MLKNIEWEPPSIPQKGKKAPSNSPKKVKAPLNPPEGWKSRHRHLCSLPLWGSWRGLFFTSLSKNSCISISTRFTVLNHSEMAGVSVYSYKHETRSDTDAISRVHNRHPPCAHSRRRLFTTTPTDCVHSWRPLCTRRVAVVHKWWRRRVFQVGNR